MMRSVNQFIPQPYLHLEKNNNDLKWIWSILSLERMQILILTSAAYNLIRDVYNQNQVF